MPKHKPIIKPIVVSMATLLMQYIDILSSLIILSSTNESSNELNPALRFVMESIGIVFGLCVSRLIFIISITVLLWSAIKFELVSLEYKISKFSLYVIFCIISTFAISNISTILKSLF